LHFARQIGERRILVHGAEIARERVSKAARGRLPGYDGVEDSGDNRFLHDVGC
jgi:hypothetical protein